MAKNKEKGVTPKKENRVVEKQDAVQAPEIQAAPEVDIESAEYKDHLVDAERTLDEFKLFIKTHNLENGKEESITYLNGLLGQLKGLFNNKNYKEFTKVKKMFDSVLKSLDVTVKEELKEKENQPPEEEPGELSPEDLEKLAADLGVSEEKPKKPERKAAEEPKPVVVKEEDEPVAEEQIIEEKPATTVITSEAESVAAGEIKSPKLATEPEKPVAKVMVSEETPVAPGEINTKRAEQQSVIDRLSSTDGMVPVAAQSETPAPKKGLWSRFREGSKKVKDAIFNRETGKATYDTIASVLGFKILTDVGYGLYGKITGKGAKGDLAEWLKGGTESKKIKNSITTAFQEMLESLEKSKGNKALAEHEKIENRVANFKAKVESANITPEAKQALLTRLFEIANKNREETAAATKEKNKEIQRVLDAYLQAKVAGIKIARDAMNLALTASGFLMIRGFLYAGASIYERWKKAQKSYTQQEAGKEKPKSETGFIAKDFAKAAIETAHALIGQAGKKDVGGVKRTIDTVKAWGIVLRGFGIYGVAVSGAELPQQSFDRLISGIKENGVASTVSENFIKNIEHVGQNAARVEHGVEKAWDAATNPVESAYNSVVSLGHVNQPEHELIAETHETITIPEHHEAVVPEETSVGFSVDQFATEHSLSPEFAHSLDSLVNKYPELKNTESMQRILDASRVGGVHSHHEEIIKSKIDTLDESGGERRQVIFEELLAKGSPESAANYLQSQNFSSRHLGYLSKYIDKDSPDGYLKFAQAYNKEDSKMVYGLFRAMQGKESTTLANAGLEGNGVDSHVRGKIHYFGVEDKKPVISGSGEVRVVEESFVTHNKVGNAAAQNEGLSTDDKLWANANVIRSMKGDSGYDGSSANASAESMSDEERAVLAEVEGDKERFARLGERHIDILDTEHAGKPVGEYINDTVQPEAPGAEPVPAITESVAVRKTINTFKASEPSEIVQTKSAAPVVEKTPELEKPLPVVESKSETAPQELAAAHDKIVDSVVDRIEDKLILRADAFDFVQSKIHALRGDVGMTEETFKGSDKDIDLALAIRDVDTKPMFTNGGHGARVWDPESKKDIFIYDNEGVFSTNKSGTKLTIKYENGEKDSYTQKQIIEM